MILYTGFFTDGEFHGETNELIEPGDGILTVKDMMSRVTTRILVDKTTFIWIDKHGVHATSVDISPEMWFSCATVFYDTFRSVNPDITRELEEQETRTVIRAMPVIKDGVDAKVYIDKITVGSLSIPIDMFLSKVKNITQVKIENHGVLLPIMAYEGDPSMFFMGNRWFYVDSMFNTRKIVEIPYGGKYVAVNGKHVLTPVIFDIKRKIGYTLNGNIVKDVGMSAIGYYTKIAKRKIRIYAFNGSTLSFKFDDVKNIFFPLVKTTNGTGYVDSDGNIIVSKSGKWMFIETFDWEDHVFIVAFNQEALR